LARVRVNGRRPATIVLVHEHGGVLELVETALRDCGERVLATRDPFEALAIVRLIKVDLVIVDRANTDVVRDLRTLQPGLSALVLRDEPMALVEIEDAVAAVAAAVAERANGR
jgi:CheY-like chemotaxis protein